MIWVCGLAALMAGSLSGQRAQFGGEENVVAVEIPVQVLVDGRPVQGLTRDNFEVLEGRKEQAISGFDVVDLSMGETAKGKQAAIDSEIPASGRRHFLLLFDLTNSEPSAIARARNAARRLVDESLHPTDLVGVATWSYTKGPRLVLGFTTDRQQIETAIETLGVVDLRNRNPDPLGLLLSDIERSGPSSTPGGGGSGSAAGNHADKEEVFLENLQAAVANERAAVRQTRTSEVTSLTQGFGALAQLMSNVLGRKQVVLLSQGFDSSLVTGSTDADVQQQAARSSESGEIWNINSEERFGSTRTANKLEEMLETFRRADCAIQSVDIGGLAVGASAGGFNRASGRETLLTMASDTGGRLYENFNNLGEAMNDMLVATSVTYVLTIQPQSLKLDGKYHAIKVRLRDAPSGARLVHRPGYYAPLPFAERSGAERQIDTAQLLLTGQPGGELAAGVVAATFRGEGGRMHVPVVIEVDGPSIAMTHGKQSAIPVAIYSYAFDPAGGVVDYVAQNLALDYSQVGPRLMKEPLKFVGDLRLPAGSYTLRTLVRVGDQGIYWLGDTPLEVPGFAPGTLDVVTPLLPTPMTEGVVVRSSTSAAKTQGLAFPFVQGGQQFYLPDAMPVLERGKSRSVCVNVYGLSDQAADIQGALVGEDGQPVPGVTVKVVKRSASDQPGLQRVELAVDPGSVPSGPYKLLVTVSQGGRSASNSTALRVGS